MGKLESEVRQEIRNTRIQRAILIAVGVAGALAVVALAPGLGRMFGRRAWRKPNPRSIQNARTRLVALGLLEYKNGFLRITKRGGVVLREFERCEYKLPRPKRWDGKWRVLIFDVRESRRLLRDKLRATLAAVGFKRLQQSVWVYPYDCEDFIMLLKADFKMGREVLYLIVDKIENDRWLREAFSLDRR